jgi:hypothetical protein
LEQKRLKISSPTIDSTTTDYGLTEDGDSSQESGIGATVEIQTFPPVRDYNWLTSPIKNFMDIPGCDESKEESGKGYFM